MGRLNKKQATKVNEKVSKPTENELTIKTLRQKVRQLEDDYRKLEAGVQAKDEKIDELKSRLSNQGFSKLTEVIENQKTAMLNSEKKWQAREAELLERDNLDYQLDKKYAADSSVIRLVVRATLWLRRMLTDSVIDNINKAMISLI